MFNYILSINKSYRTIFECKGTNYYFLDACVRKCNSRHNVHLLDEKIENDIFH